MAPINNTFVSPSVFEQSGSAPHIARGTNTADPNTMSTEGSTERKIIVYSAIRCVVVTVLVFLLLNHAFARYLGAFQAVRKLANCKNEKERIEYACWMLNDDFTKWLGEQAVEDEELALRRNQQGNVGGAYDDMGGRGYSEKHVEKETREREEPEGLIECRKM